MPTARKPVALALLLLSAAAASGQWSTPARAALATIVKDACSAPTRGRIGCDAEVLVARRSDRMVHPRVERRKTPRNIASTGEAAPQPLTPAYLQQAYDLSALSATRGAGDTIAIVGVFDDPTAASDLNTFRSTFGLPACTTANGCFQQLNEQGRPTPLPAANGEWAEEESMDIEAVSALCPNCRIDLFEASDADAQDLQATITAAIGAGANQISISGDGVYSDNPFTDFSAPGVSIVAATGDDGALPAGEDAYPAALPYVTAVGATTLSAGGGNAPTPRGVTEATWDGSAAGCDTQEQPLPYQPNVGCAGRMYADVSADGDPATGLTVYEARVGGWFDGGGTSLSAPLVAAFEAVTGVDGSTPQWAYNDAAQLNDPSAGTTGNCIGQLALLCNAAPGYDGPTGAGSISGQLVAGAPGIGLPSLGPTSSKTYTRRVSNTAVSIVAGVYPNGEATTYYLQYGTTVSYSSRTKALAVGGGTRPVLAAAHLAGLKPGTRYHYRLVAVNGSGTTYGYDASFVTSGHAVTAAATRPRHRRGRHGQ